MSKLICIKVGNLLDSTTQNKFIACNDNDIEFNVEYVKANLSADDFVLSYAPVQITRSDIYAHNEDDFNIVWNDVKNLFNL